MPFALGVMGTCVCILAGCGKEEAAKPDPASPSAYMKDPAFRQQLKDRRKEAVALGEERAKVAARMDEMAKIMGEKLQTADRAKIVAALSKLAEWRGLEARAKELDAAFENHRKETLRVVRERITPQKDISK